MNRRLLRFALLLAGLIVWPLSMLAQEGQSMPQMPVDKDVRIGKLPNGLTYYIRHNEYPKGQADFYIAQQVGSILENDDQRGLAHFLEHMCFNGTTHFPDKELINWLGTVGVKFGRNLNAMTGVDMTVYQITNVPVERTGVQDSCLLILHDWANDLTLDPAEIDKERGVIHEEWRQGNAGQMRILENLLPTLFPGSPYGHRLPIGTMEVVDNFPPQALRDYYEKWYRPDLQGIIVVGDIDVDRIEGKIKEMFADIEMPENPAERVYFPVADHEGTIYAIGHDPEQKNNIVQLMFLSDPLPREMNNTPVFYQVKFMERMISMMLNQRFEDLRATADAPFAAAGCTFGNYLTSKTKDAYIVYGVAKDNNMEPVLQALYREVLRAAKGGFTQGELDRARSEYLKGLETQYNNRATRENNEYVREYVDNFLDNEPIPGIEIEYQLLNQMAPMVTVDMLNQVFAETITKDNRVVVSFMTDNEEGKYPTEESFTAVMAGVDNEEIASFVDNFEGKPLIAKLPKPGKIVAETTDAVWGTTVWTLSNGAKVVVKPTKFKEDQVLMLAWAYGGWAGMPESYASTIKFLPYSIGSCGLGDYTNSDLSKYLSGKQVSVSPSFDDYDRMIDGATTPGDLPSFMEILYMTFTGINFTPEEFTSLQNTFAGVMQNQEKDPQYIFSKTLAEKLYASPMAQALDSKAILEASREQTIELAHAMTANAADYTFTFVGNVDLDSLRPLVEQYIASLPGNAKKAVTTAPVFAKDFVIAPGVATDIVTTPMQTPTSFVAIIEQGHFDYTSRDQKIASIAGQVLTKRLVNSIREEMGAVYSIGASCAMRRIGGYNNVMLQTAFPMKPEMQDEVLRAIKNEIQFMGSNVTEDEVADVKKYLVKEYTEAKEKNSPWLNAIVGWQRNGVDTFNGDIATVEAITAADVMKFMRELNNQWNYRVIVLAPEEAK